MNLHNHPTLEAHRLACIDLVHLMNLDWYDEPRLEALAAAISPWTPRQVDVELQALYRPRYTLHFRELTGRQRVQDCPEDYLRGFRAIAMAQKLPIDVFESEPRRFNARLQDERTRRPA